MPGSTASSTSSGSANPLNLTGGTISFLPPGTAARNHAAIVTVSTIAGVRAFDRGLGRPRGGCLVTCKRLAGRRSVVEEEPRSWGLLFVKYA